MLAEMILNAVPAGRQVTQDFVLPKADDMPAERAETAEVALVAGAIGAEFIAPELGELVFPCGEPPAVQKSPSTKTATRSCGKTI